MTQKDSAQNDPSRGSRRTLGALAIVLIVALFLLLFFRLISFLEWIIGVLLVWVIANFLLRRMKKQHETL
ncbi:MAG: hypothetical protein NWF05_04990 [Candidatus Bathyarchaeota archaeon]|nr:hypothetical protein [Candidatus Bathyarchaeota archaeon]